MSFSPAHLVLAGQAFSTGHSSDLIGVFFQIDGAVLDRLVQLLQVDILDITANVGDAIVAFRDWIDQHNFLAKGIEKALPYIESGIKALRSN